jgi:hypothetical protein
MRQTYIVTIAEERHVGVAIGFPVGIQGRLRMAANRLSAVALVEALVVRLGWFGTGSCLCDSYRRLALDRGVGWWLAFGTMPFSSKFLFKASLAASSLVLSGLDEELVDVLFALWRVCGVSNVAALGVRLRLWLGNMWVALRFLSFACSVARL